MKKQIYTIIILIILSLLLLNTKKDTFLSATAPPYEILNDINQYRLENGLGKLEKSVVVCGLAAIRVQQIKTDFSHSKFQSEINKIPVRGVFYENLAIVGVGSDTRKDDHTWVVPAWKKSKDGHNEAMLIKNMTLGCVVGSDGAYVFEGYIKNNKNLKDPIF